MNIKRLKELLGSKSCVQKNFSIKEPKEMTLNELRTKWGTVPAGEGRITTEELLLKSDEELLDWWLKTRERDITGERFSVRGWYHLLYKEILKDKYILDVGCGLGIDGITFAQAGANVTFFDIVKSNIDLVSRICNLLQIKNTKVFYLEDIKSISDLGMYDVIWSQGSLHNAPASTIKMEVQEIVKHLKIGGRWIQLAYPKTRWERDGKLPFDRWGAITDGEGTPWCEWYDLSKLLELLEPAKFKVVLYFEFHNSDFNWFDLVREK